MITLEPLKDKQQEFIKPRQVTINAHEVLDKIMPAELIKDLHDNEEICPVCKGLGIKIVNNPYGLSNDPDKGIRFPYNHQSVSFCPNCYNGVVRICEHCGKQLPKGRLACDCDYYKKEEQQKAFKQEQILLEKAKKITFDDPKVKDMGYFYYEQYAPNDGFFSEIEEFIDWWLENHEEDEERPKYIWGTYQIHPSLDLNEVLEMATSEMHESAIDELSHEEELQKHLDEWIEKQWTSTYNADYETAIEVPWPAGEK